MEDAACKAYIGLSELCRQIKDGRYVMSGNTIAALLKYIASQPVLLAAIERCNYGFGYANALDTALAGGTFKLPLGSRKIVALITGLLFEFDRGSVNMHNFIKTYYRSSDIGVSFDMFCTSVITPYCMAFNNVLSGDDDDLDSGEIVDDNRPVRAGVKEQIIPLIISLTELVAADNTLDEECKEEYFTMLDGLYYSFELSRSKMIKVVWTGMNALMRDYKSAGAYLRGIHEILERYSVI